MISSEKLGERVSFARRQKEMTQAQLAEKLGISRATLIGIEKGERRPSDEEIVKLAGLLSVEIFDLLREHAVVGEASARFRAAAKARGPEAKKAAEELRLLGAQYTELEALLGIKRVPATLELINAFRASAGAEVRPALAGQDAASLVRRTFGLGDGPLLDLDDKLEIEAGFRIFYLKLDPNIAALFLWGDELGACVGINLAHPRERRRFSLAHECGHFLRDREIGDLLPAYLPKSRDPSEIFCDAFASDLLMPAEGLRRRFSEQQRLRGTLPTIADLVSMAVTYQVSFQAMTLRLEEIGLLRAGYYETLKSRGFQPRAAERELGYGHKQPRPTMLPRRYEQLAFEAFDKALISESELAAFLRCDRMLARALYSDQWRARDEEGQTLELDLSENVDSGPTRKP